jgi:hypothetical protein
MTARHARTCGRGTARYALTSRFLTDFYLLVGDWAAWAADIAATWPDDPSQASPDPAVLTETLRRAADGSQRQPDRSHAGAAMQHRSRAGAEGARGQCEA